LPLELSRKVTRHKLEVGMDKPSPGTGHIVPVDRSVANLSINLLDPPQIGNRGPEPSMRSSSLNFPISMWCRRSEDHHRIIPLVGKNIGKDYCTSFPYPPLGHHFRGKFRCDSIHPLKGPKSELYDSGDMTHQGILTDLHLQGSSREVIRRIEKGGFPKGLFEFDHFNNLPVAKGSLAE